MSVNSSKDRVKSILDEMPDGRGLDMALMIVSAMRGAQEACMSDYGLACKPVVPVLSAKKPFFSRFFFHKGRA